MSIQTRIFIPLVAFIVFAASICLFIGQQSFEGQSSLEQIAAKAVAAADSSRGAREAFDQADRVVMQVTAMTDFMDPRQIKQRFEAASSRAASNLDTLKSAALSPEMLTLAQNANDRFIEWRGDAEILAGLRSAKEISTIDVLNRRGEKLRSVLDQAVTLAGRDALKRIGDTSSGLRSRLTLVLGIAGAVALAGLAIAFQVARSLSRPLTALVANAERLAAGDLTIEVASVRRKDEIGAIARAVAAFRANIEAQLSSQSEASRHQQMAEQERTVNEAARADIQGRQDAVVVAIAEGLDRLSKGDLTNRLKQQFPAGYEKLRADFNATAASLQNALTTISAATTGIGSGSDQIAHASDDLSRRTEQQAANLEETAAALNFITATVKDMAANAGEASKIVVTARTAAESSGTIVAQAVEAMSKIKGSSQRITNIIGVIDEIAFQTNLLALNAGVEAARAGDAGRGFAVVASEVRALAQRSAEAAKEIKALISASTVQVQGGVALVDQTGTALKDIISKFADMDALVRKISASSREQATGIAEINIAVAQMDQAVQQNAAMVEESTAAAHALKSETQDLSVLIGKFQIG